MGKNSRYLRKHLDQNDLAEESIVNSLLEEDIETVQRRVLKFIAARGQNIFECSSGNIESVVLVEMPPKYRNALWIKRGKCITV